MGIGSVSNVSPRISVIPTLMHPHYRRFFEDWIKWRSTYEGGDQFIRRYLVKFSNREDDKEFGERRKLAYCPAFAKSAIREIRNGIYKRSGDIVREGGSSSYQNAVNGRDSGVDLNGSDMNYFMNIRVLDELLPMSRVGVFVDMPKEVGETLVNVDRPYIYLYQAEDIRSYTRDRNGNFTSVLLIDHTYSYDIDTQLPLEECSEYRFLYTKWIDGVGNRVFCRFYDEKGYQKGIVNSSALEMEMETDDSYDIQLGNLTEIPFHLLDIENSLLADAANYQIAHMNMASSDTWFATRANFPFYIEPFDPRSESPHIKHEATDTFENTDYYTSVTNTTNANEIAVGPTRGRRYPIGTNQPAFIHPSTDPLKASMAKQDQMKAEIRELITLSVTGLAATNRQVEDQGPQNGLAFIAMILENAENRIAYFWSMYEGSKTLAEVQYPEQYEILKPEQIEKEVTSLSKLIDQTTSMTLKRRCMKVIAELKVSGYVKQVELAKIFSEIDSGDVVIADNLSIKNDLEGGLVSLNLASKARGYPEGEVDKAANDHAERLARIQAAQTPVADLNPKVDPQARGLPDLSGNPKAGQTEKAAVRDQTTNPVPTDPTRGNNVQQ